MYSMSTSIAVIHSASLKNWGLAIVLWLARIARDMDWTPQTITPEEETVCRQVIKEAPHRGNGALLRSQASTPKLFGHVGLNVARGHTRGLQDGNL